MSALRSSALLALLVALVGCTRDEWRFRPIVDAAAPGDVVDAAADVAVADVPAIDTPQASGRVVQFVTAARITYAVRDDGLVFAAGEGAGAFEGYEGTHRNTFVAIRGLTDVAEVSSASQSPHVVCARHADGTVTCKDGSTDPIAVDGVRARRIAGRCALLTDGGVACWDLAQFRAAPVDLTDVVALAGNGSLHCALRRGGTVWCWGEVGAVLDVPATTRTTTAPVMVPGITTATSLAVGRLSACAVVDLGAVVCWGRRSIINGGPDANTERPIAITGARGVRTLTPNSALTERGEVLTWGGAHGTRGDGTYGAAPTAFVAPGVTARAIAEGDGELRVCTIDEEGHGSCWGEDFVGELGVGGGIELHPLPVLAHPEDPADPASLDDVVDTMLSGEAQCALLGDGSVRCWGCPAHGTTGAGVIASWPSWQPTPTPVAGLTDVTALVSFGSTQNETFGALLRDGTVRLWGQGMAGALGNGGVISRARPGAPDGLADVARLVMGEYHACAIARDATVSCWGIGTSGQLGDGSTSSSSRPVPVARLTDVVDLALGTDVSVALRRDGSMHLWGRSQWLLSTSTLNPSPIALPTLPDVVELAILTPHNFRQLCARRSDGHVSCLGANLPSADRWFDLGLEGVTQISASASGTGCARHADGGVSCWGINRNGELGDARVSQADGYHPPQRVLLTGDTPLDRVTRVRAGIGNVCAVRDDHTLWCWGAVNHGVTGRGRAIVSPLPRRVLGL